MTALLRRAVSAADVAIARSLIEEYARSLGIDLAFQDFATEVATLPGAYAPPGGVLLLGEVSGVVHGCVALRPLEPPEVAELKRLYVRPVGRGHGLGRALTLAAIEYAWNAGYQRVRLDTLPSMASAQQLYRELGFRDVAPYRHNPIAGTAFLELEL